MGAGQSDLYEGTYGDDPENIPGPLKGKIGMPPHRDQLMHIMKDRKGHLPDTAENRKLLIDLANDLSAYVGKDIHGNEWSSRILDDGSQLWVKYRKGEIQDGGLNQAPRNWDKTTGFNNNPFV